MKTRTKLLILSLLLTCNFLNAQKIKDEDIKFKYKQLPLNPLDKKYTSYKGEVVLEYVEADKAKKAEYDSKNQEANQKYAAEKKESAEKYAKEKEDYKNKSFGTKLAEKTLLGQNTKPTQEYVSKESVAKPFIRNVADANLLATTYIILDGYKKSSENAVIVQFIAHGFEYEPVKLTEMKNYSTNKVSYRASFNYRHPITIKILSPDRNTVLWEAAVEETNSYSTWTSGDIEYKEKAERVIQDNASLLPSLETPCIEKSMKKANELLNKKCGFSVTERKTVLNNVEGKKFDYADYASAYVSAAEAYMQIIDFPEEAKTKLLKSIELWNLAMQQSTPSDKKSRVNNDVTFATIWNLAEAYTWTNDYAKAKAILVKTATLDLSNKEERKIDALKTFIDEQQTRYELNN